MDFSADATTRVYIGLFTRLLFDHNNKQGINELLFSHQFSGLGYKISSSFFCNFIQNHHISWTYFLFILLCMWHGPCTVLCVVCPCCHYFPPHFPSPWWCARSSSFVCGILTIYTAIVFLCLLIFLWLEFLVCGLSCWVEKKRGKESCRYCTLMCSISCSNWNLLDPMSCSNWKLLLFIVTRPKQKWLVHFSNSLSVLFQSFHSSFSISCFASKLSSNCVTSHFVHCPSHILK